MIRIGGQSATLQFYHALVATSNSLALSQLWTVEIPRESFAAIHSELKESFRDYEDNLKKWDFMEGPAEETFHTRWFLNDGTFYLLARGCSFPGDSMSIDYAGSSQTGMLKAPIGTERSNLPEVTITFLETNQSVADLFFRPWMILASHLSLKEQALRIPIILTCWQKTGVSADMAPRKKLTLHQAVPISIDTEEYNYTADKVIDRQIRFTYNRYSILANEGLVPPKPFYDADMYNELNALRNTKGDYGQTDRVPNKAAAAAKAAELQQGLKEAVLIPPELSIDINLQTEVEKYNLLDVIRGGVELANKTFTTVKGIADTVQGTVIGIAQATGLYDSVSEIRDANEWFDDKVRGEVLGTAGDVINIANRGMVAVDQGIAGYNRLSQQIANMLGKNPTQDTYESLSEDRLKQQKKLSADAVIIALNNTLKKDYEGQQITTGGGFQEIIAPPEATVSDWDKKTATQEYVITPAGAPGQGYELLSTTALSRPEVGTEAQNAANELAAMAATIAMTQKEENYDLQKSEQQLYEIGEAGTGEALQLARPPIISTGAQKSPVERGLLVVPQPTHIISIAGQPASNIMAGESSSDNIWDYLGREGKNSGVKLTGPFETY